MKNRNFTLMIVPDAHAQVKRIQVRRELVYGSAIAALVVVGVLSALIVHYVYEIDQIFEARALREENQKLERRIAVLSRTVEGIDQRLAELQRFDEKLRDMTKLNDGDRGLAMGPVRPPFGAAGGSSVDYDPFAVALGGDDPAALGVRDALLDSRLEGLGHDADRQLGALSQLVDYFSAQEAILASTPSVWPARGWITSGFGTRDDPYTGERVMHLGVDMAAREGTPVVAPARGVVIYSGDRGAYGRMIAVDHDRGVLTHYAHLSRALVKVGDVVERGQHIGNVGNTGRSTGPHLHYEVRVNGVPVNPRRYVLE